MDDLIKTAGEMITTDAAVNIATVVGSAGGFMLKEGGKIALGVLIRPKIEDVINSFRESQAKGEIPEGFEKTSHGAALLQEALNALLGGLEEARAEAVKKVFLGLAMNPVTDSLERVEQLEIMRITSELTAWEIVLINALERYNAEVFDRIRGEQFDSATSAKEREEIKKLATRQGRPFADWLFTRFCNSDKYKFGCLKVGVDSLHTKRILSWSLLQLPELSDGCVLNRRGAFTDFGWKFAVNLYSAKDE